MSLPLPVSYTPCKTIVCTQVGRLELENMELEQHRIVHESILKGKDLAIQKLRLQVRRI